MARHYHSDVILSRVMAGLVPAIHTSYPDGSKTWVPGTRPGMTGLLIPDRTHRLEKPICFSRSAYPRSLGAVKNFSPYAKRLGLRKKPSSTAPFGATASC
jgi:hypothetical protein